MSFAMNQRIHPSFVRTAAAIALLGGLGAAQAEGLYVGGSLGKPDYTSAVNGFGGGGGGQGTGLKFYGGYQLTPNFAVEGGLFDLGKTSDANGSAHARGVYLDGVGSYAFAPQWSVLGSLGVAEGHITSTAGDDRSPALKLGLGLQYDLTKQVALRAQYDQYRFVSAYDGRPNVGAYSVGVKVGF
jgi:OOP family OmpA-OmpF porin